MFRIIIWALIIYLAYKMIKLLQSNRNNEPSSKKSPAGEETVKDPVCGLYIAKSDAIVGNLEGEKYYFCSMNCLNKFREQLDNTNKP